MKLRILLLAVLSVLAGCSKTPQKKVEKLLETAQNHLEKFELEQAQAAFDQAAAESKTFSYDKFGKAQIFERQLYYYEALNEYLNLSLVFPDSARVQAGIYRNFRKIGHAPKALEAASKYFELAPKSEDAAIAKIQALFDSQQFQKAKEDLESAAGQALDSRTSDAFRSLAYSHLNDFDSSRIFLDKALEEPKVIPEVYFICAAVLENTGKLDSAMVLVRQAADLNSAPFYDLMNYFEHSLVCNYYSDARKIVAQMEKRGIGKEVTLALQVLMAQDQGNYTRAIIINADYSLATPRNASTVMFDMAAGGYRYNDPMTVMSLGQSAFQHAEALKYHEDVKVLIKLNSEMFKGKTEDLITALQDLKQIKSPLANIKEVTLMEAYLTYRTGDFENGLKKLRELRTLHSSSPDWLTELADIYAHPSNRLYDTALKVYDDALKLDYQSRNAFEHKIQTLRYLGKYREALSEFDKYPNFERNYHQYALLKAFCLAENDQFAKAMELIKNNGGFQKGNIYPFREMATVLEKKYRNSELKELAELCAGWSAGNTDMSILAARLLSDLKSYKQALELSEQALNIEPGLIEAKVQKARALYGTGERAPGLDLFEQIEKEDQGNGELTYYFSQILAQEKIDHDHATNLARASLRSYYSDEKAFLNLCQVYAAYGDYKFAHGDALKGLSEYPQSAQLWFQLGLAAHQIGRSNFTESLKKAIDLGLGGEDLKKAKEILANP